MSARLNMLTALKRAARDVRPFLRRTVGRRWTSQHGSGISPSSQDLDIYWDPQMGEMLETWGEDHVWNEIQLLLANCSGRVLDVACGTGAVIQRLQVYKNLDLHGIDISDALIERAVAKSISRDRLHIGDATALPFRDGNFEHAYSIGSLEHFTSNGIERFIAESRRVASTTAFHMVPVARSGRDEGWRRAQQSYFNNSVGWWLQKFASNYADVLPIRSAWHDDASVGYWFICR